MTFVIAEILADDAGRITMVADTKVTDSRDGMLKHVCARPLLADRYSTGMTLFHVGKEVEDMKLSACYRWSHGLPLMQIRFEPSRVMTLNARPALLRQYGLSRSICQFGRMPWTPR